MKKELMAGNKVRIAQSVTDEQLESIGMKNVKINDNLRKYESTVSEILSEGSFKDNKGNEIRVVVLDSTFTLPEIYLEILGYDSIDKSVETEKVDNDKKEPELENLTEDNSDKENEN